MQTEIEAHAALEDAEARYAGEPSSETWAHVVEARTALDQIETIKRGQAELERRRRIADRAATATPAALKAAKELEWSMTLNLRTAPTPENHRALRHAVEMREAIERALAGAA